MAELTRSYDGPGIGRGGIIVIGLILVVLVSLFFIPEIIEFEKSLTGGSTKPKVAVAKTKAEPQSAKTEQLNDIPAAPAPSSLDQLSSLLDRNSSPRKIEAPREDARASMGTSAKAGKASKSKKDSPDAESNWDRIRSAESKQALTNARKRAIEVARKVPERDAGTRYALFNFANGVDFVLERGPQTLNAHDASSYINSLHQAVTHAMNREGVDRSFPLMWSKVDLGPGIMPGNDRIDVVPFNPSLTLTWLKLMQSQTHRNEQPLLHIKGGGFVRGWDIDRVELVNNYGTILRRIAISRPTKNGGYRLFQFGAAGNQPFTIRVYDKSGKVYQKTYDFYQGAHDFRLLDPRHFEIPFRMSFASSGRFYPENVDPRLDSHFISRVWRGTQDQLLMGLNSNRGGGLEDSSSGQLFSNF